jgi:hypothetical protein
MVVLKVHGTNYCNGEYLSIADLRQLVALMPQTAKYVSDDHVNGYNLCVVHVVAPLNGVGFATTIVEDTTWTLN